MISNPDHMEACLTACHGRTNVSDVPNPAKASPLETGIRRKEIRIFIVMPYPATVSVDEARSGKRHVSVW
jgi:hypothetical protein